MWNVVIKQCIFFYINVMQPQHLENQSTSDQLSSTAHTVVLIFSGIVLPCPLDEGLDANQKRWRMLQTQILESVITHDYLWLLKTRLYHILWWDILLFANGFLYTLSNYCCCVSSKKPLPFNPCLSAFVCSTLQASISMGGTTKAQLSDSLICGSQHAFGHVLESKHQLTRHLEAQGRDCAQPNAFAGLKSSPLHGCLTSITHGHLRMAFCWLCWSSPEVVEVPPSSELVSLLWVLLVLLALWWVWSVDAAKH